MLHKKRNKLNILILFNIMINFQEKKFTFVFITINASFPCEWRRIRVIFVTFFKQDVGKSHGDGDGDDDTYASLLYQGNDLRATAVRFT